MIRVGIQYIPIHPILSNEFGGYIMKAKFYKVRTTKALMKEMSRYEGSKVLNSMHRRVPAMWKGDAYLEDAYATYLFIVEGTPNMMRWHSFQVDKLEII
jgi:hypothetical protein